MSYLLPTELPLANKKVLLRTDFNVPLDSSGNITDPTRIAQTLPTIKFLLQQNASIIILSHMGRPKGAHNPSLSLHVCSKTLSTLLDKPVLFAPNCLGNETKLAVQSLLPGQILLLENLRFYAAEEHPDLDPSFVDTLASYGDVYIDDAFGAAHRNHASIVPLAAKFPLRAAGFLLDKEIRALTQLRNNPKKPFHLIIGGAKISSKLGILHSLLDRADALLIGGAMAFTFLKAQGFAIGDSLYEEDLLNKASELLDLCEQKKVPLLLPKDLVITDSTQTKTIPIEEGIPSGWKGVDIGQITLSTWKQELCKAKTVFWNGPLGLFENPSFAAGTYEIAQLLTTISAFTVIGGGDSVAAIQHLGLSEKISHVSTGGGASLEFLEKGTLPGIEILDGNFPILQNKQESL